MATKKSSAQKRYAQSEVRRLHNKAVKSECHTYARKYMAAIQKKDKDLAATALKDFVSKLDKAVKKGVMNKWAVSRKKSRMAKLYNVTFAAPAAEAK